MDWKSEQEIITMEYFRELFPDFPAGRLVKHETPDFLLVQNHRRMIGIELIQIHSLDHEDNGSSVLDAHQGFNQIEHAIRQKEEKIDLYRGENIHKLWLILTAEEAPAKFITRLHNYLHHSPVQSPFNEIYLFLLLNKEIIPLTKTND